MKKVIELKYGPQERLALSLARLCYPIALSIEARQPATALKLLECSHDAHRCLHDTFRPWGEKTVARKLPRAVHSTRCTRAILKRLLTEEPKEAARVTAAHEMAERLIEMLKED